MIFTEKAHGDRYGEYGSKTILKILNWVDGRKESWYGKYVDYSNVEDKDFVMNRGGGGAMDENLYHILFRPITEKDRNAQQSLEAQSVVPLGPPLSVVPLGPPLS